MAFTEDLTVFFDTGDFAVAATLQGGTTVNVVFDRDYVEAVDRVSTTDPVCMARVADITASNVGQTLVISGTTYTIRDVQRLDDGSLVRVQLEA